MEINLQSLIESLGIISILGWIIVGLNKQLKVIGKTVEAQSKTLDTMERRVIETEKIGELYKNLFNEIPEAIEKYKDIIQKTKDATIDELERARERQDLELTRLKEQQLKHINIEEKFASQVVQGNMNTINISVGDNSNINVGESGEVKVIQIIELLRQIKNRAMAHGELKLADYKFLSKSYRIFFAKAIQYF